MNHPRGRPSRYQAAPNFVSVRHRGVENPFVAERIRIRLRTPPQNYRNYPNQLPYPNNSLPPIWPDRRPPRDVISAQSENLLSNATKSHQSEYVPEASGYSLTFTNDAGLTCTKFYDGNQTCFECVVDGERRKECMYSKAHKPTRYYEAHESSQNSNQSLDLLTPNDFDSKPTRKQKHSHIQHKNKPKSDSTKQKKSKKKIPIDDKSNIPSRAEDSVYASHHNVLAKKAAQRTNNKQRRTKLQPYHSDPEIIYGKPKSDSDTVTACFSC